MITKREEEEIESLEAEVDPDDSIHEMIDVENDAIIQVEEGRASTSSRQTLLDTPNMLDFLIFFISFFVIYLISYRKSINYIDFNKNYPLLFIFQL